MLERIIVDDVTIRHTVTRIAHEILEYSKSTGNLILLGAKTRSEYLADRIQDKIYQIEQQCMPTGTIGITYFRDDIEHMSSPTTEDAVGIGTDITGKVVIIINDMLYTGRTVRASLDAILLSARPVKIGSTALVDRGHRGLPIRADFAGKDTPASKEETVSVYLKEMNQRNTVAIK